MLRINFINHDHAQIDISYLGHTFRVVYLFADKPVISGGGFYKLITEEPPPADFSETRKNITIQNFGKYLDPPLEKERHDEIYKSLRQMRAAKHKDKDTIVRMKKLEKAFEEVFQACWGYMKTKMLPGGFTELKKLKDGGEIEFTNCSSQIPEEVNDEYTPYLEVLKKKWEKEDEMYLVPGSFPGFAKEKGIQFSPDKAPDGDNKLVCFQLPFIPGLIYSSATAMRLVKRDVFGPEPGWKESLAEWSEQLRGENFSAAKFDSYSGYFSEKIEPGIKGVEERMQQSDQIRECNNLYRGQAGSRSYLCIAPAGLLWDYFTWGKLVPDESMKKFREKLPDGCREDSAVLFLLCDTFTDLDYLNSPTDKKSLAL